jgi:hypothetical protein
MQITVPQRRIQIALLRIYPPFWFFGFLLTNLPVIKETKVSYYLAFLERSRKLAGKSCEFFIFVIGLWG